MASRFFGGAAMTLLRAAVAWHVFQISGSAFQLGLIGIVQFIPALSLTLVGGAVADAYDRRRVILATQFTALVCSVVLFLATESGAVSLPLLYGIVLLAAVASAFESPSRASLLPTLVPREHFPRAVTIAATNQALAFVTGPALGGFVIAAGGIGAAYAAHALLILGSLAGMGLLHSPPLAAATRAVGIEAIREGVSFVRRQPVVLGCMALDMFAVIFGGATSLLPIYAHEILNVGARGYGILSASLELGALAMSILLMWLPPIRHAGRALLVAVALYGVATIVFGLSRWFPLSVAAYVAAGMADQVSVVLRSTAIQLTTPDAIRGRVSAVNMIFIGASNQLGAAESGFLAALTSAPFAVVSGGFGCLVVVAIVALRVPALRRYRTDTHTA
jgi:MFS family permease